MRQRIALTLYMILFVLAGYSVLSAQSQVTLDDVLQSLMENSFAVSSAKNQKNIADANYQFFQSQLKPAVSLRGSIPNYSKTFSPVIQPDGTISFTSIKQANSALSLFASQVIPSTGGTIFLNSDLQRFDNFSLADHMKQYNGNPLRLGINQPLFGFNPWKYQQQIQTLLQEEAGLDYNIRIEESLGQATDLYFNILIAKQNLEIAKTNQLVNEKLLVITDERLLLGKVSKDEKLQLEIELNSSKISASQAGFQVEQAIADLYTFLGAPIIDKETQFIIPDIFERTIIDVTELLNQFKLNRPELIAFEREKKEAEMDKAQAKAEFGIQADLQASIGLARGALNVKDVYTDPFDEQQVNVSLLIPILDWGKKKGAIKQIEFRQENVINGYEQAFLELENSMRQRALLFTRLQTDIDLLRQIMDNADERFTISNERYVLGNIDITNLTLAQREKDQTKRNYINALKTYWVTYYELRALSGFDILNKQKIIY